MDPTVWGPSYWMFLHTVAANYPKHPNGISKKVHYRLLHNFHEFIPHSTSATNFRKMLELYPVTPYLDSRNRLMEWVNFIHNKVNEITGKPKVTLSEHRDNMKEM
jgi:FAD-linked sulfhydryl oxidase